MVKWRRPKIVIKIDESLKLRREVIKMLVARLAAVSNCVAALIIVRLSTRPAFYKLVGHVASSYGLTWPAEM